MEALPAARVGLTDDSADFRVEAVVDRRLVPSVDLQIHCSGLDVVPERLDEGAVRKLGREDGARQQDHTVDGSSFMRVFGAIRASTSSTKPSTAGCAGLMT